MRLPKASIVILNYNSSKEITKCLTAVEKLTYPNFEVIIVDNGSTDNCAQIVDKYITHSSLNIKQIETRANLGFSGGNNRGVREATTPYVVLLNPDTEVFNDWLTEMMTVLMNNPNTVIVGSTIHNSGKIYKHRTTVGSLLTFLGEPYDHTFKDKNFTVFAAGASFLFRKDILGEPFDTDFFMYAEDVYACWLARLRGYDIQIAWKAQVHHIGGVGLQRVPSLVFHAEKNKAMNTLLFYEWSSLLKLSPLLLSRLALILSIALLKRRFFITVHAYLWVASHTRTILTKRKDIQAQRVVSDDEVLHFMTYKIPYSVGRVRVVIDFLSLVYCKLMRLEVYEFDTQTL